jgi:hypothetical protein
MHSLLALFAGVQYDAEFFCTYVSPGLEKNMCQGTRKRILRGIYLLLTMRQVTTPNSRDKKLPERKP